MLCVLIKIVAVAKKESTVFYDFLSSKSSEIYLMSLKAFVIRKEDIAIFKDSYQNYIIDLEDVTGRHVSPNHEDND